MALLLLLFLAALPLLGVIWIAVSGSLFPTPTIDALFMSLILLSMSAILGLTAAFELRKRLFGSPTPSGGATAKSGRFTTSSGPVKRGTVKEVVFYEAHVGQPNKSLVTLAGNGGLPELLVVSGDVRNALPVGQRVQITMRREDGQNILSDVRYA